MRGVYLGNGQIKGLDGKPYVVHKLEQFGYQRGMYVDFEPCGILQWVAVDVRRPNKLNTEEICDDYYK